MADTNTANLLLLIADLGDTFNFGAHVEANFTTIDGLMGAVDCTSTARPTNTYKGQIVYEHDSLRYAQNTGTKGSPVWTYMSHAAMATTFASPPTSGLSVGEVNYETDTTFLKVWNGSSWEQKAYSNQVVTSSAHSAHPFTGLQIFETNTGAGAVYNGSNYMYDTRQVAASQILVGTTASVTFSGIPPCTRLSLFHRSRLSTASQVDLLMQIDGNVGSAYLWAKVEAANGVASGSHAGALTTSIKLGVVSGTTTSYFGNGRQEIDGWSNSTGFMTCSGPYGNFDGTATDWAGTASGQFNVVGPHTSVKLFPSSGSFAAGSQFTLYGSM